MTRIAFILALIFTAPWQEAEVVDVKDRGAVKIKARMKAMRVIWYHVCGPPVSRLCNGGLVNPIGLLLLSKRRENLKQLFVPGSANLLHQPLLVLLHQRLCAFQQSFSFRRQIKRVGAAVDP